MTIKRLFLVIFFFCCCLVLTLPAKFVYQWLDPNTDIQLSGINGSLFHGQIQQVHIPANKNETIQLENIAWSFNPLKKILNSMPVNLHFNDDDLIGTMNLDASYPNQISVDADFHKINLAIINPLLNNFADIIGKGSLNIHQLSLNNQLITALNGQIIGNNIHLSLAFNQLNIETVSLSALLNHEQEIVIQIKDMSSANSFEINWRIKQQEKFIQLIDSSGYIVANSNLAKQLKDMLPVFARKQGNRWQIEYSFANIRIPI
ncbi:MAG: type II secretion system protein N [Gammaproteobacteria bacterium]|nr:type II secretion system protein N [Gammaproteobacteria bacterium]